VITAGRRHRMWRAMRGGIERTRVVHNDRATTMMAWQSIVTRSRCSCVCVCMHMHMHTHMCMHAYTCACSC